MTKVTPVLDICYNQCKYYNEGVKDGDCRSRVALNYYCEKSDTDPAKPNPNGPIMGRLRVKVQHGKPSAEIVLDPTFSIPKTCPFSLEHILTNG